PQYGGPQHGGPQHGGQQFGGPQYSGPQYGPQQAPQQGPHQGPQYGPQYGPPQTPPQTPPSGPHPGSPSGPYPGPSTGSPTWPRQPAPAPRQRPSWLLPAVAAGLVVVVAAGGVGAYFLIGDPSGKTPGTAATAPATEPGAKSGRPSSDPVAARPEGPDVCAMLPKTEADRLVPGARIDKGSRDGDYTIDFTCNWLNREISYGEFWRSREIDVKVRQHKGDGPKTGRSMAQVSYEAEYGSGKYRETAKPEVEKDEKEYISPVKDIPGVGDGAWAQYTWRRDGDLMWYSYGTAFGRVGDMTIEVKYQADQRRKDARILSNETTQSVTEENAVREVSGLIGHIAKGVAAWQAKNPDVLAKADPPATASQAPTQAPSQTPSATPSPSASPTVVAAFPPACQAVAGVATELVPEPTPRARALEENGDTQSECRWLNLDLTAGGQTKVRSALITTHRFFNRAGGADASKAKSFYLVQLSRAKFSAESSLGEIKWGKLQTLKGVGEQAHAQYTEVRKGEVFASSGTVMARVGAVVVEVAYSGAQRPKGQPANSPKTVLMAEKEARDGALKLAKAYLLKLAEQPEAG
ncbi:hypothetical protein HII36_44815, partial [Nonomuraea sp. NN258]|nr:hypothetical protein [Nonomuraea antri]